MQVDTANNWEHLQELLFADTWNEQIGRYRSAWAYRGLSDSDYQLSTTLMRMQGDFAQLERHLLRNFKKYAHRDVVQSDSFWHWLSVAQHHGLPTRLMDWTHSPMVAMHFATANTEKFDTDGVVWCINYEQCHTVLPPALWQQLVAEGANTLTTELLSPVAPDLAAMQALAEDPYLVFFEPPSMDDRIVNQFALFSVMSHADVGLEHWVSRYPELCKKVIIPAKVKWEIRDKLDQSNMTERVLFPGLDGLSQWLGRHYSPRDKGMGN